jgi:hypothetical protein
MSAAAKHFVICINNGEYAGTLELRKVYEVLEDSSAAARDYARIIDESGEDYLYPQAWFVPVAVPESIEELLHGFVIK